MGAFRKKEVERGRQIKILANSQVSLQDARIGLTCLRHPESLLISPRVGTACPSPSPRGSFMLVMMLPVQRVGKIIL